MISVRAARVEDVGRVLPMVAAICALHSSWDPERYDMLPDVVERYRRWLPLRAGDPRSVFLLAEELGDAGEGSDDGDERSRMVGFLIATVEGNVPIYRTTEFGFIHDVWVQERVRGKGVGRELVLAALEKFRVMDVGQVRLETATVNEAARKLFASCGFRVGAVEMMRSESPPLRHGGG